MKLHHPLNPLLSQAELSILLVHNATLWAALKIDPRGTMSNAIENISEALLSAIGFRKDGGILSDVFKVDVVPRVQTRRPLVLPLRDEDYTEDIKEVQAYLDKVKKIVRPGCSQEVLNVAVSSMSSLARILSALSSEPKPRASL